MFDILEGGERINLVGQVIVAKVAKGRRQRRVWPSQELLERLGGGVHRGQTKDG